MRSPLINDHIIAFWFVVINFTTTTCMFLLLGRSRTVEIPALIVVGPFLAWIATDLLQSQLKRLTFIAYALLIVQLPYALLYILGLGVLEILGLIRHSHGSAAFFLGVPMLIMIGVVTGIVSLVLAMGRRFSRSSSIMRPVGYTLAMTPCFYLASLYALDWRANHTVEAAENEAAFTAYQETSQAPLSLHPSRDENP